MTRPLDTLVVAALRALFWCIGVVLLAWWMGWAKVAAW